MNNTSKVYSILIIDDDPTLRLIANKKLSQSGYKVLAVGTGTEGIQSALDNAPDLIILDYGLPDMTGIDVCLHLRNNTNCQYKPILFITGKDDNQAFENAYNAGATDFSRKPINWVFLIYRIRYMLRSYEIYISLLISEKSLNTAQKIAKIANWEYLLEEKKFKWSENIHHILDLDSEQKLITNYQDFLDYIPSKHSTMIKHAMENCFENHKNFKLEHELITAKGTTKVISHLGNFIDNESDIKGYCVGTIQDITDRHEAENTIRKLAFFDSLTGLMNRESFLTALDRILTSNKKYNLLSALLFIDLDDFKRVNDTLGHECGDKLLCEIADRLKKCVRTAGTDKRFKQTNTREISGHLSDSVFRVNSLDFKRFDLGRLGGDEFTVFLADIFNEDVAATVAKRLLEALEQPFLIDEYELFITFSIGIAIAPNDGDCIKTLLKSADVAMYNAKSQGKNNFQFYTETMNERSMYRLMLESDLRHALDQNELYLVYQPQVCLHTGRIIGAETLMRWKNAKKGEIPPSEFIPLAEKTGQIKPLGEWLFKQFSHNLFSWNEQGLITENFKLSLNVSSLQLQQPNMIESVKKVFFDLELNKHVNFELSESVMMKNSAANLVVMNALVDQNISLSIDDFGTGYSSLSYLHRYPIRAVKIDQTFISSMENDGQFNIIVRAIVAMAHSMELTVVAEGIESQSQLDALKADGCDIGQGFFLYKPMLKDQFQELLTKQ